jgi:NAD(P)-dependent dehydrogenase (short-subunit alcohol dehydrogenase family)
MKKAENKVALITGGAGSIGKAAARLLLAEGAKVMLVDNEEEVLLDVVDELDSSRVYYCIADVSQAEQVKRYVDETVARVGKIDIFLNNAGIMGEVNPVTDCSEEVFDRVMAVNVKGIWLGCKYAIPQMNDGGSLILTSSMSGLAGTPNFSGYVTSKHAVIGIMRSIALEMAPRRIRVNTINPGPVDNDLMRGLEEGLAPGHGTEARKQIEATIPLGRYAQAEEVAGLVSFLASDDSRYITGTTQVIAGGFHT